MHICIATHYTLSWFIILWCVLFSHSLLISLSDRINFLFITLAMAMHPTIPTDWGVGVSIGYWCNLQFAHFLQLANCEHEAFLYTWNAQFNYISLFAQLCIIFYIMLSNLDKINKILQIQSWSSEPNVSFASSSLWKWCGSCITFYFEGNNIANIFLSN